MLQGFGQGVAVQGQHRRPPDERTGQGRGLGREGGVHQVGHQVGPGLHLPIQGQIAGPEGVAQHPVKAGPGPAGLRLGAGVQVHHFHLAGEAELGIAAQGLFQIGLGRGQKHQFLPAQGKAQIVASQGGQQKLGPGLQAKNLVPGGHALQEQGHLVQQSAAHHQGYAPGAGPQAAEPFVFPGLNLGHRRAGGGAAALQPGGHLGRHHGHHFQVAAVKFWGEGIDRHWIYPR